MKKLTSNRRLFIQGGLIASGGILMNADELNDSGMPPIKIALVGCGGRGFGAAIQALEANPNAVVYALADYFDDALNAAMDKFLNIAKQRPKQIDIGNRRFSGLDAYQKAITSGCDLVILATPPGFRPLHFEYAIKQNKHVFMEKPVAVDAPGVRQVLAATEEAKMKNLYVAVGLQRRHQSNYIDAYNQFKSGAVGRILSGRVYWVIGTLWYREQISNEFDYQMRNWYYFNWLSGDQICEQHIHNLDVFNWFNGGHPLKARGFGGREVRKGQKKFGEIFDHTSIEFTYENGVTMQSYGGHIDGAWADISEHMICEKGRIDLNHSGSKIYDHDGKSIWKFSGKNEVGWSAEWTDLMKNLAAGKILNEGEYGAHSTLTAILGRTCAYSGKEITWNEILNSNFRYFDPEVVGKKNTLVMPDKDGLYPCAIPGATKCF
ncbi:MAG: hypothetical protein RL095_2398 [Verrucomicrobiota bacterium]|jgi:predicted dehydrogenase